MRNHSTSGARSVSSESWEALLLVESLEASLDQILKLLEQPDLDAMEQCSRLLEPCFAQLAGLRESVGRQRPPDATAGGVLRGRLEAVHHRLRRLGLLVRHAAEFQVGCAAAGIAAPAGYTPRGTSVPELPVRRLCMEG